MAILDIDTDDINLPAINSGEKRVYRTAAETKTSTIFNKDKQLDSIVQYVQGMSWSVEYFLQIRDIYDTYNSPDINVSSSVQKYNRISKLELKLQSGITQDDPENITGEAIIHSGFLPNIKDAFLATLTGGRMAIFTIEEIEKKTYNLKEVYLVNFKLFSFIDTEGGVNIYNDLLFKTMKEYTYDKDHLLDYSAPIIMASDYKRKINLKQVVPELSNYYVDTFTNPTNKLLALRTTSHVAIDSLLDSFVFKILDQEECQGLNSISRVDIDMSGSVDKTIWNVILNRDLNLLKRVKRYIGFKFIPYAITNATTRHATYLGVRFVVDILKDEESPAVLLYDNISLEGDYTLPIKHPVGNNYVLSEAFYKTDLTELGLLEEALMSYLRGEVINNNTLDTLIRECYMWSTLEQYYLIPILIVLVKDSVNNTYTTL